MKNSILMMALLTFTFGAYAQNTVPSPTPTPAPNVPAPNVPAPAPTAPLTQPEAEELVSPKIVCRTVADPKIGFFFETAGNSLANIIAFNEGTNSIEKVEPVAFYNGAFSETLLYFRLFQRQDDYGMYTEFIVARFWKGGRKINPGQIRVTEASYTKDTTGKEVEELKPLGKADLRCGLVE